MKVYLGCGPAGQSLSRHGGACEGRLEESGSHVGEEDDKFWLHRLCS